MRNFSVSNSSDIPIYHQLYDQITAQILSGELKSNTLLPSIRTMAKEIRVSIITIKKAWEEMERDGFIYTVSGKGSYVADNSHETLNTMKHDLVKDRLKDSVLHCKELDISKAELIEIVKELYEQV